MKNKTIKKRQNPEGRLQIILGIKVDFETCITGVISSLPSSAPGIVYVSDSCPVSCKSIFIGSCSSFNFLYDDSAAIKTDDRTSGAETSSSALSPSSSFNT